MNNLQSATSAAPTSFNPVTPWSDGELQPCPYCAIPHAGVCHRVRAFEYSADGRIERVEFHPPIHEQNEPHAPAPVLLDTSVVIDGRIADVARTGFVAGEMLVPHFVLGELQRLADSADAQRRSRGRHGLEMLRRLQDAGSVRVVDLDAEDAQGVDDKLVALACRLHYAVLTTDYNLNRVAELQGVRVLNVNDLANAVKPVFLPGESLAIEIVQKGKESGQGVGYLDSGLMIVVEGGAAHVGRTVEATVTKVLQTAAGRLVFARLVGL